MIELKIDLPLSNFNLNKYTQNARTHWAVSNKAKKELQLVLNAKIKNLKLEKIKTPCRIIAIWQTKARNFDLDNMLLKAILDELQNMELLENDNVNHITEINHKFELNKEWQGVKLYFIEIGDNK